MWGFAWLFWLIPFLLFMMLSRHWRAERWVRAGAGISHRLQQALDDQRLYVDQLEGRVAELEERLDFTERLLAKRGESDS